MTRTDQSRSTLTRDRFALEICIDSVAGARAAERGGAQRVELCAGLIEGGTTPSLGMVRGVLAATRLPVMTMIRPRGGHFVFDDDERDVMYRDAALLLEENIAGIVIGALLPDGSVDRTVCQTLTDLARQRGRSVTFHRAFDQVADPDIALELLIDLRIDRVLTSGQAPSAELGIVRLQQLQEQAAGRIVIMPGCGVRSGNAARIVTQVGTQEIHCSASELVEQPTAFWRREVPMMADTTTGDLARRETSWQQVTAIRQAITVALATDAGGKSS